MIRFTGALFFSFIFAPCLSLAAENFDLPRSNCADHLTIDLNEADQVEEAAFNIMEQITLSQTDAKNEVTSWHSGIKRRQDSGEHLSVLEHTTLVFAFRTGFIEKNVDPLLTKDIMATLAKSWVDLTGGEPPNLLQRLPRKVLRRETHEVRQFHAAAFQNSPASSRKSELALGKDYLWNVRDFLTAMGTLAIGFSHTGSQALAGTALGYAMATFIEYGFHRFLAHAPKKVDQFFEKIGGLPKRIVDELKFSHLRIHHKETFKKAHNVQFANEKERENVDRLVLAQGRAGEDIVASRYGLSLSKWGVVKGLVVALPFSSALTAIAHLTAVQLGLQPNAIFDGGAVLTSLLFLPATGVFHPYLHLNRSEVSEAAGPVMRWFLKTRYAALMSRVHYGHHRGRGGNYSLVFGADLVFGTFKKATVRQLLEMKKRDYIY